MGSRFFAAGVIAAWIGASLLTNGEDALAADQQTLYVSLVTCPDATYFKTGPKATLYPYDSDNGKVLSLVASSPESYTSAVTIEAGHYQLAVDDGFCEGSARVTVVAGHDRHVGLVLAQNIRPIWSAYSSVVAVLPGPVTQASLLGTTLKDGEDAMAVDGGVAYDEYAVPGSYLLRLAFRDSGLEARIPVTVHRGVNVLQVTPHDIQRYMGYLTKYPLQPAVFHQLWGENQIR